MLQNIRKILQISVFDMKHILVKRKECESNFFERSVKVIKSFIKFVFIPSSLLLIT